MQLNHHQLKSHKAEMKEALCVSQAAAAVVYFADLNWAYSSSVGALLPPSNISTPTIPNGTLESPPPDPLEIPSAPGYIVQFSDYLTNLAGPTLYTYDRFLVLAEQNLERLIRQRVSLLAYTERGNSDLNRDSLRTRYYHAMNSRIQLISFSCTTQQARKMR